MTKLDAYIGRVTLVLAEEFGWDDLTCSAFASALVSSARWDRFEFICDPPVSARWRVKNAVGRDRHPWALRMAYYGDNPDKREREEAITKRLTEALP